MPKVRRIQTQNNEVNHVPVNKILSRSFAHLVIWVILLSCSNLKGNTPAVKTNQARLDNSAVQSAKSISRPFTLQKSNVHQSDSVTVSSLFGNNMILQQNTKIPVWGWSAPEATVKICVSWGKKLAVKADRDGKWIAWIRTPKAIPGEDTKYTLSVESSKNKITFSNVLIGEVWICTGQSNMWMPMSYSYAGMVGVVDYANEIAAANYPNIRLFTVPKDASLVPLDNCTGTWSDCNPTAVSTFSAVGYYFGRELFRHLNIPIGLINDSYGGSSIQAWMKRAVLDADPELKAKYSDQTFKSESTNPSRLYNAMIAPVIPFAIKGAIWYQGESNVFDGSYYTRANLAMLKDWRTDWGRDFSFYAVQLTPRLSLQNDFDSDYRKCMFREAQSNIMSERKTGIIVTTDLMLNKQELSAIHPRMKKQVGMRLAYLALAKDYGQKIQYLGPKLKSYNVQGHSIKIDFLPKSIGSGLSTKDGMMPKCFKIAGDDQKFYPAMATIEGNSIVVTSSYVNLPVAVRYAFSGGAITNLMNKEGIAAFPFRTDKWDAPIYVNVPEPNF